MKVNIAILVFLAQAVFLLIFTLPGFAQESWEWQHPEPLGTVPRGVQIIDENTIYFTGSSGAFYKTTDAGQSWDISYLNTLSSISSPHFANAQVGFVSANNGKIFKTTDAGDTWQMIYEDPGGFQYQGIDVYDENNIVIAAQKSFTDSKVLITSDGGETWKVFDSGVSENADSIFYSGGIWDVDIVSPDTIYARGGGEGEYEAFYQTFDGGDNWDVSEVSVEGDVLVSSYMEALQFVNDAVGFVVGPGGGIFKTVNGGESWKRVNSQVEGEEYYLNNIFFLNEQKGWVGGFDNDFSSYTPAPLFYTNDGGETWTEVDWVDDERFLDQITFYDENLGYAIGRTNGGVYRTTDGGSSWEALFGESIRSALFGIDATDDQNAWAVGADGAILATSNGGENWNVQNSDALKTLRDIQFLDTQNGWAVGDNGTVITTTNGGENWTIVETGVDENLRSIKMLNPTNGWIVGDNSLVLKTSDGGDSWESESLFPDDTLQLNSIVFIDDSKGWLGGEEGTILHTADGGETWNSQETGLLDFDINDFFFLDENNGWAVCSGGASNVFGRIIRTQDGGTTWEQVATNFPYAFYAVHFVSPTKGWIAGFGFSGNNLLVTNDGGETWNTDTNLRTTGTIYSLDFVGEGNGWVTGGSGSILKYFYPVPVVTDFSPKRGYRGIEVTINGEYFTDATTVKFNDAEAEFTVLDDNTISAIVPGTTDGAITVVTPLGTGVSDELFTIEIATGIEDGIEDLIKIYPNPNNGSFSIQLSRSSGQEAEGEITLHNALGRKIPGNISTIENGKLYMDYTSSALPPGMYILNISTGKRVVKRKILVE